MASEACPASISSTPALCRIKGSADGSSSGICNPGTLFIVTALACCNSICIGGGSSSFASHVISSTLGLCRVVCLDCGGGNKNCDPGGRISSAAPVPCGTIGPGGINCCLGSTCNDIDDLTVGMPPALCAVMGPGGNSSNGGCNFGSILFCGTHALICHPIRKDCSGGRIVGFVA